MIWDVKERPRKPEKEWKRWFFLFPTLVRIDGQEKMVWLEWLEYKSETKSWEGKNMFGGPSFHSYTSYTYRIPNK